MENKKPPEQDSISIITLTASLRNLEELDGVSGVMEVHDISPTQTQVWFITENGDEVLLLQLEGNLEKTNAQT